MMNCIEKILAAHAGKQTVSPGDIIEVELDYVMSNDACTVLAIDVFQNELKAKKVFDPEKVIMFMDHYTPSSSIEAAKVHRRMREFAGEQHLSNLYDGVGICHQLMIENHVTPRQLIIGADSHTCSYGCLGALATGMGSTDIAIAWQQGKIWMKVPETLKIHVTGTWPNGVYAKDLMLNVVGKLTASGATYKALYFTGEAIKALSISGRTTLCNMAIETGAKFAYISPDEKTAEYLGNVGRPLEINFIDEQNLGSFEQTITIDVSTLEPQIARPGRVDDVCSIATVKGTSVDELFLGACTNGSFDDLAVAAQILENRTIAPSVRMLVTPASNEIYLKAVKAGFIETFVQCGAMVNHPGCSACFGGSGGILGPKEVLLSTANRNFKGRVGSGEAEIYLASPAVIAASAITGTITDPREV